MIEKIYNDFENNYTNIDWISERSIIAPINKVTKFYNEKLIKRINAISYTYKSIDTMPNED